jgi:hypothetical protein
MPCMQLPKGTTSPIIGPSLPQNNIQVFIVDCTNERSIHFHLLEMVEISCMKEVINFRQENKKQTGYFTVLVQGNFEGENLCRFYLL